MTPAPDMLASDRTRAIGRLCVDGDRACTQSDLSMLGDVAERLAEYAHEPLHDELAMLSQVCRTDPDRAVAAWYRMKELAFASCDASP